MAKNVFLDFFDHTTFNYNQSYSILDANNKNCIYYEFFVLSAFKFINDNLKHIFKI